MKTIAIINQKGGSGKTTTAVNLAACLADCHKSVLLIDLDPQYSATMWLSVPETNRGIIELLAEEERGKVEQLIRTTSSPRLSIIPSSPWLVGAEKALSGVPGAELILREALQSLPNDKFDYVLLDCPPALNVLSINALAAAEEVLVPVEAHVMGLQGLAQLHQTVEKVKKRLNPKLFISGILACRVDSRTNHSKDIIEKLRQRFPVETFKTVIRENVKLAECPSSCWPIIQYAPDSPGAVDYRELASEILEKHKNLQMEEKYGKTA